MPVSEPVVRRVKRDFGIGLTDAEIACIGNKRDLYYVLEQRAVSKERDKGCRSTHIFYQLRRAFVDKFGVERCAVTPDASVARLMPLGRLYPAWRALAGASGLQLPDLKPSPCLAGPIAVAIAVPAAVTGLFLLMEFLVAVYDKDGPRATGVLLVAGLVAAVVFGVRRGMFSLAARVQPQKLPSDLTLRDLIRGLTEKPRDGDKALWRQVNRFRLPEGCAHADIGEMRTNRETLRDALVAYMREDIWAFQFDEAIQRVYDGDRVLLDLSHVLWTLYDDLFDHPVHLLPAEWSFLRRTVAALSADLPLEVRDYPPIDPNNPPAELMYEPFSSAEQWQHYEPLLELYDLPEYDAALHAWRFGVSVDTLTAPYWKHNPRGYAAFMVVPSPADTTPTE